MPIPKGPFSSVKEYNFVLLDTHIWHQGGVAFLVNPLLESPLGSPAIQRTLPISCAIAIEYPLGIARLFASNKYVRFVLFRITFAFLHLTARRCSKEVGCLTRSDSTIVRLLSGVPFG